MSESNDPDQKILDLQTRVTGLENLVLTLSLWMKQFTYSAVMEDMSEPEVDEIPYGLTERQRFMLRDITGS